MPAAKILAAVIDNADVGLYVSDYYTGDLLFVNKKIASYTKYEADALIGKKCWELLNEKNTSRCPFCPFNKLIDENGSLLDKYSWEFYLPQADKWLHIVNQALIWTDGRLAQLVTFYDITEMKKLQESLTNLAYIDQHMRLKNGLRLELDVREAKHKPSLIVFDIASLHKINEAYGRDIGDKLLASITEWILSLNMSNSELYRVGGDEFCVAFNETDPVNIMAFAEKLRERFYEQWVFESAHDRLYIYCNASIAMIKSLYIKESDSLLNLIERSLKTAKNSAKLTVYNEEMDSVFKKRIQLELSLKKCVRNKMEGFDVYYQPIANPITGTWCGVEALCRWNSPELGQVSPHMFIPEAERLELIDTIGLWVLETAVRKCKEWGLDKHESFVLDVNLSAVQFLDETLGEKIIAVLTKYNYPGKKLSIEITESTQFTFTDQSLFTIEILREHKILVALDDFGTGYSSFNSLESLPIDILKIERIFVTNIETDGYKQYLFHVMAELAHSVDMTLIAEGVENSEQMDILLRNGADLLQGYLFSKPISPTAMITMLYRFYEPSIE